MIDSLKSLHDSITLNDSDLFVRDNDKKYHKYEIKSETENGQLTFYFLTFYCEAYL